MVWVDEKTAVNFDQLSFLCAKWDKEKEEGVIDFFFINGDDVHRKYSGEDEKVLYESIIDFL